MSPIDQALNILAATAWQGSRSRSTGRKSNRVRRRVSARGLRILKETIAMLNTYRAKKGVA